MVAVAEGEADPVAEMVGEGMLISLEGEVVTSGNDN